MSTQLLAFGRGWDQRGPLVIHCWAGISRSTAAAFITLCALRPERDEAELARRCARPLPPRPPMRGWWPWPTTFSAATAAWCDAIAAIGRGADAFEGTPFRADAR